MKTKIILIFLLIIAALILISLKVFQSTEGPHGGVVKKAGEYYIEMKSTESSMYVFLLDKKLKPLSNKEITCRILLLFSDNSSDERSLAAFGTDGFFSELIPKYYISCKVIFNVSGKYISVEFENETLFVKNK